MNGLTGVSDARATTTQRDRHRASRNLSYGWLSTLIIGLALFTLVMGGLTLHFIEDHLVTSNGNTLALAAADIASKLDRIISERHGDLAMMSRVLAPHAGDRTYLTAYLTWMKEAYPIYLWLGVADRQGRIVAATDSATVGQDVSKTVWFQKVRQERQVLVEDLSPYELAGGVDSVAFSAPIIGPQGTFLGVATARIQIPALEEAAMQTIQAFRKREEPLGTIEYQFLTHEGRVFIDSDLAHKGNVNLKHLGLPSALLSEGGLSGHVQETHLRRGLPVVTGYARTRDHDGVADLRWGVLVRMDRSDILAPVRAILWKLGWVGAVVCMPLFGLLLWANRRLRHEWTRASEEARRASEAEAKIQEHEARTRLIVDRALDAVITLDGQGRITGWNLQAEVVFGWPQEDTIGRSLLDTILPSPCGEALDHTLKHYSESSEGLVLNRRIEVTARHRHGHDFPVEFSISPLRTHQELSFSIFARDITHRKRADQRLATQHAVTRILAESPTLGDAAPRILAAICAGLEWDLGALWLVDRSSHLLRCEQLWHTATGQAADFESATRGMTFAYDVGLPGRVWASGQPAWIPDIAQDADFPRAPAACRAGLHGAFAFPILLGRDVLGVLEFFNYAIKSPDDNLFEMLAAIGSQIGQFIERRQAEDTQRRLVAILEATTDFVATADRQGRTLYINRAGRNLLGIRANEDVTTTTLADYHPEWASRLIMAEGLPAATRDGVWSGETVLLRDGREIPVSQVIIAHKTPEGEVAYFSTIMRDLTDHKRAEQVLRESQLRLELHNCISTGVTTGLPVEQIIDIAIKRLSGSFPSLCAAYCTADDRGLATVAYALDREGLPHLKGLEMDLSIAPAYLQALRRHKPVMVGDLPDDASLLPVTRILAVRGVQALLAAPVHHENQLAGLLCFAAPQARTWTQHEVTTLTSAAESLTLAVKNAKAEQERQRAEEQLRHDALHDTLTGLPNRTLFMDRLGHALARMKRRPDYLYAVLFLDLDRFKVVNDSLGHLMGDELLISISRRLQACLRAGDTVARLGGDEFAVLLDDLTDSEQVLEVSERIQQALAQPVMLDGHEVRSSASIGIAMSVTGYDLPSDVLRDADLALYRAKSKGRACHEVYDQALHAHAVTLMQLETDLQRALERKELLLHYQPIVSLATGRVTAFEALARWRHPQRGLVSPGEFIPVAEDTGLIVPLGQWALREACRQVRAWRERFPSQAHLSVCVNLSAKQFAQPDLVEQITGILHDTGLEPSALGLEITESVMMEQADRATAMLTQLRARNIPLHLDDFGTGYSSLSYLHRFPIDLLKIDRSFVSRIGEGGQNSEIVQAIVSLAHNLKIGVIAEGVETAEQLALLRALECDFGQGYYFAQPMDSQAVEALLAAEVPWHQLVGT